MSIKIQREPSNFNQNITHMREKKVLFLDTLSHHHALCPHAILMATDTVSAKHTRDCANFIK